MHLLADLSSKLEHYAGLKATKWAAVAETLQPWIDKYEVDSPLNEIIPNLRDFSVARILGISTDFEALIGSDFRTTYDRGWGAAHGVLKLDDLAVGLPLLRLRCRRLRRRLQSSFR